eukprot:1505338-Prymnesium_polylepis.2
MALPVFHLVRILVFPPIDTRAAGLAVRERELELVDLLPNLRSLRPKLCVAHLQRPVSVEREAENHTGCEHRKHAEGAPLSC